jgi:hypothetical protein
MKGTFFSADFVKDANNDLRLIEINTDTGLTSPQAHVLDWSNLISVLGTNNITNVEVVYKYDIQDCIIQSLSSSLAVSAPFITTFNKIVVPGDSIFPTSPTDEANKFILRLAYDETAILDSEYAKGTLQCLTLFADAGDSGSIINFYHSSSEHGYYNTLDTELTNPSNVPDFVTKTTVELMQAHKFCKVGHSDSSSVDRINDFIANVDSNTNIIQQYHISPSNLTNQKVTSVRAFQIVYGSDLAICPVAQYEIEATFGLPTSIEVTDSNIVNNIASKHYYEFATNYVKCENEGFLGNESVTKVDETFVQLQDVAVNDYLQAYYVDGAPETDDFDVLRQWSYAGGVLPTESHISSSYVANKFSKTTYANDIVSITFDNNAQIYIGGETRVLAYDLQDDVTRYVKVLDLDTDDSMFTSAGEHLNIASIDVVIFENQQDVWIVDMQPINNFILETNGVMALLVVHNALFCFAEGTKVLMADGSEKNIEDVVEGDEVLSFNESTLENEIKKVIGTKKPIHNDMVKYVFANQTEIVCTFDHPFYVNDLELASFTPFLTNKRYEIEKEVKQIKVGDLVHLPTNRSQTAIKDIIELDSKDTQTHIITVEDNHNFYANGILVHNK